MEYVYAALLLHKAGKEINEESLTEVLKAAGVNVDSARVKALVASVSEIDIDEVLKSAVAMPVAPVPQPTEEVEKKEEEKEEEKEEAALEGLGALFG